MSPSIVLEKVGKQYGAHWAVRDVSLTVRPGEVVGLLGPNGAGKSTTLRMIAGLLTPTHGQVWVGGQPMSPENLEARKYLGFMTASTALYDRLTGREQLSLFGRLYGLPPSALKQRIALLSEKLRLEDFLDKRVGALSSGQKQRLSIARAVVHEPSVYVLDEPTSMLDPVAASAIWDMVKDAREKDKAVLFSTHRMEEVEFLCDRLVFLNRGSVVTSGSVQALREMSQKATFTETFLYFAGVP